MVDFKQLQWDDDLAAQCEELIRMAVREDLAGAFDWTTVALVPSGSTGRANLVARRRGVLAGMPVAEAVLAQMDPRVQWSPLAKDGQPIESGQTLATIAGPTRSLLTAERPLLNFVGHLTGIATLTARYVAAVAGTGAKIYDTRKTLPGWRLLEKYAVGCGGGHNHRTGLYDAILIKDNHLAATASLLGGALVTPADAVKRAQEFLAKQREDTGAGNEALLNQESRMIIEVEVDTLEQLRSVLTARPDIVLLDNMTLEQLRSAVVLRGDIAPQVELEASGGVILETVDAIAQTGVDRISVGALTHSACWFDVGLDWEF